MPPLEPQCEEKFLHGGRGPGGQKINKCNSKVQLKHIPTGIVVECQQTRSRDQNRKIAREKMALEIERLNSGGNTIREQALQQWHQQSKKSKEKKAKDKHEQHRQERELQQIERLKEEQEIIRMMRS